MLPAPEEIIAELAPAVAGDRLARIEIYLPAAYGDTPVPATVRQRLEKLPREGELPAFYICPPFERVGSGATGCFALRLGNSFYPHMKMLIGPTPAGGDYLFRADTHDRHVQVPPESPEYAAMCQMLAKNHAIGVAIESVWESAGLPTFKQYLRNDLARRRAGESSKP